MEPGQEEETESGRPKCTNTSENKCKKYGLATDFTGPYLVSSLKSIHHHTEMMTQRGQKDSIYIAHFKTTDVE